LFFSGAAEDQRIAVFRSDAGRRGGGGMLLRRCERCFRAAATAVVQ